MHHRVQNAGKGSRVPLRENGEELAGQLEAGTLPSSTCGLTCGSQHLLDSRTSCSSELQLMGVLAQKPRGKSLCVDLWPLTACANMCTWLYEQVHIKHTHTLEHSVREHAFQTYCSLLFSLRYIHKALVKFLLEA